MGKKVIKWIGIALFIICLMLLVGCKKQVKKSVVQSANQTIAKDVVEAFGTVKARDYKDINLGFPAQIVKVPVKDGQNVKMNEALVYLNINDFLAMIKNKENELNLARFELLKQQKNLAYAQDAYEKAYRQLKDKEELLQKGAISERELDDFKDLVKEKERIVTDIKLSLAQNSPVSSISVQTEKVAVLEYDLKRMKDKLNQSFLQGNIIVSDYPRAVVYDIRCAAGYSVGVGTSDSQQKLLSIMNLNSLYVSGNVAEEFIKDVKIGTPVTIIPVADNMRKYQGKVTRIADMAVQQNGETNVAVEISISHPDSFLRPNFNVDIEILK